ncbi:hypothetical protein BpJC7_13680 [Weizmannia acidilactici]|uniref:Uncharacterized protein n=1 Tax=Weizmannia acidilactici TaxID=2607726 RepID=A0A5J4JHA3_9BACI|nr:hypothetical protein [Weizmannia acidilactici]GER67348.1 hypothetical protein BpJC4_18190 [Weizmannia acidilactici]GER70065.1 hypothetical protein BpJC7_13680 [Weizmannia acidilactici]GER74267.1 hypothetical protein BpPP18_23340 [Weizmannia acidilactici]
MKPDFKLFVRLIPGNGTGMSESNQTAAVYEAETSLYIEIVMVLAIVVIVAASLGRHFSHPHRKLLP